MHGEGSSDVHTCITYIFSPSRLPFNTNGSFGAPVLNQILHQCCTNVLVGIVWWGPLHCDFAVRGADIAAGGPLGRQGLTSGVQGMLPGGGGHWTMVQTWWDGSRTRGTLSTRVPRGLVRLACHSQPFGIIVYTRITGRSCDIHSSN